MPIREFHLDPIPYRFQIFDERLEVAGVVHRKADATTFIQQQGQWLELEPEPSNRYDKNAIRVIGCWKGLFGVKRVAIGYVPRDVARVIIEGGFLGEVSPRLSKTYLGDSGFVEILFQLIGPKERTYEYRQALVPEDSHYTQQVDRVKHLKRQGRLDEAIELLLRIVEEIEDEARGKGQGWGVAPWYYDQLAIIYRKQGRFTEEVAILERYVAQPKAPGAGANELAARLEKARALRDR